MRLVTLLVDDDRAWDGIYAQRVDGDLAKLLAADPPAGEELPF